MAEAEATPRSEGLRDRTRALACVAAAIASDVDAATLERLVRDGLSAGATDGQIVATLYSAAPLIGSVRLVQAAPELAVAVGYDIGQAFEHLSVGSAESEPSVDDVSVEGQAAGSISREIP